MSSMGSLFTLYILKWSSLVEGDEQLDCPNSQQLWNHAMHVLQFFFGFRINTTVSAWADPAFIFYY